MVFILVFYDINFMEYFYYKHKVLKFLSCGMYQDPDFWKYRPLSELTMRAATDDERFLLYIYNKMVLKKEET